MLLTDGPFSGTVTEPESFLESFPLGVWIDIAAPKYQAASERLIPYWDTSGINKVKSPLMNPGTVCELSGHINTPVK